MKLNKNLILIGMMASGKSTIGRLLAKKLNLKFFDTDFIIEKKAKMKIIEIFQKKGEPYFRNLEKKITLSLLNKNNCVISLGGGAFINEAVRKVSQKDYMKGNLLQTEIYAKDVAKAFVLQAKLTKTTGNIITVDGGNIEASLR